MINKVLTILQHFAYTNYKGSLPLMIFGLVIAILACFLGYRFTKLWIAVIGFACGTVGGALVSSRLFDNEILTLIVSVVVGFFVAMLAVYIYLFGIILESLVFGALIAAPILQCFIADLQVQLILMAVSGVVFAVLAIIFLKPIIICMTGVQGGIKAAQYIILLIPVALQPWVMPVMAAGIAVLGILVQFLTTKDYKFNRSGDRVSKY
ncbi:MAG: DUF4203 domain-containing protein [Clostridiales bacterium]|nr:DUF4203 domain-containing protein [Clostridiales bacterium]